MRLIESTQPATDIVASHDALVIIKRQNPGAALGNATGGGRSPNKALAIALGVGIPVILLVGALIWWSRRRKARQRVGEPRKTEWGKMRKGAIPKVKKPPAVRRKEPGREGDPGLREKTRGGQGDDRHMQRPRKEGAANLAIEYCEHGSHAHVPMRR